MIYGNIKLPYKSRPLADRRSERSAFAFLTEQARIAAFPRDKSACDECLIELSVDLCAVGYI